jgi:hypothetical protein
MGSSASEDARVEVGIGQEAWIREAVPAHFTRTRHTEALRLSIVKLADTTDTTLTHDGHDVKAPGLVFVVFVDPSCSSCLLLFPRFSV